MSRLADGLAGLAARIRSRLEAHESPDRLVPLLREQADATARFREAVAQVSAGSLAGDRAGLAALQQRLNDLVRQTDENHRLAAGRGVRISGLGGKPRPPARSTRAR